MRSFKKRIIIWTTAIAGVVMLGFALGSLFAYERLKEAQVDAAIELLVRRPAPPPFHAIHWERLSDEVVSQFRERFGEEAVLAIYGPAVANGLEGEAAGIWGGLDRVFGDRENWPEVEELPADMEAQRGSMFPGPGRGRGGMGPGRLPVSVEIYDFENGADGGKWKVGLARHLGYNLVLAVNLESGQGDINALRKALLLVFPVALVVLGSCIGFFVTKAMRPVSELGSAMEGVSATSLRSRVEVDGVYSEFDTLIERFNEMLVRLEKSFRQANRFSADAAHELKTPLTIIQGHVESALQAAPAGSREQVTLAGLLEEVFRLKAITRKLLILAQADAGQLEVRRERVDLRAMVEEALASFEDSDQGLKWDLECEGHFEVEADESLTRQIVLNLVGNAVKYRWPAESKLRLRLRREGQWAFFEIENACRPIDERSRKAVFERFTRVDASRNRETEGAGLGLSLALEFAKAQGGRLELLEGGDRSRIGFRFGLPV